MSDTQFISGLIVKAPNERAPEYVKAAISIKREELIAWLQSQDGEWINADVKVSQGGKWYVAVNTYKKGDTPKAKSHKPAPAPAPAGGFDDDDIPFN